LLDAILGGGFPVGAFSMIVGLPASGKSTLAFQTLANAQKVNQGKILAAVLDSEEATTQVRLAQLGVVNPRINPHRSLTVEKVFKYLEALSLFKAEKNILELPSVVIWDSIANTLSEKEFEAEDPNTVIGYKARLLSMLVPKYVSKCAKGKICWIAVNQLRDKIQMTPFPQENELKFMKGGKTIPGGNILKFNAFHLVEVKVSKPLDPSKVGFDGVEVKVRCVKNKAFAPNIEIKLLGSFTNGFSNFWTNYQLLVDTKRLNAGAWNYLVNLPEKKFRTKDAEHLYETDPEFVDAFDDAVSDAIQTDYIDKYDPKIKRDDSEEREQKTN
jgi:RecA/RadA recombinase